MDSADDEDDGAGGDGEIVDFFGGCLVWEMGGGLGRGGVSPNKFVKEDNFITGEVIGVCDDDEEGEGGKGIGGAAAGGGGV